MDAPLSRREVSRFNNHKRDGEEQSDREEGLTGRNTRHRGEARDDPAAEEHQDWVPRTIRLVQSKPEDK